MKIRELIKKEDGAALPIITLIVVFVMIGVTILIIDAGSLYGERRTMVSAADSAALAGANIMEDALGVSDMILARTEAEKVAKDIAVANGVKNRDDVNISWDRINYNGADRDVITVRVRNDAKLIFGYVWGDESTGVTAKAVGTWGFVLKLEGGNILPIFVKTSTVSAGGTPTYLHAGKFVDDLGDVVNGNWGLIDIYGNGGDISRAFAGEMVNTRLQIDYTINNQTGLTAGKIAGIEQRMIEAAKLATPEERKKFMTALVPVIDFTKVTQQGSSLVLPIDYFLTFEIQDVIITAGNNGNKRSEGSSYAMYDTVNYASDGVAKKYDKVNGFDLKKTTIIGQLSGDPVQVNVVVEGGDQINPSPEIVTAKYSKLIK